MRFSSRRLCRTIRWNIIVATGNKPFKQIIRTIKYSYKAILGYFKGCFTNATAESFNAKINMFRTEFRGICDPAFFKFRLQKLFAYFRQMPRKTAAPYFAMYI